MELAGTNTGLLTDCGNCYVYRCRRPQHASLKEKGLGGKVDAVSISERQASVADRAAPPHWERDLIAGSHYSHIATLVERHSRYLMLVKVESKKTDTVIDALIK